VVAEGVADGVEAVDAGEEVSEGGLEVVFGGGGRGGVVDARGFWGEGREGLLGNECNSCLDGRLFLTSQEVWAWFRIQTFVFGEEISCVDAGRVFLVIVEATLVEADCILVVVVFISMAF
jgi:hypothetical protein